MGKASRAKRERPSWARKRDVASIVQRVQAIEAGITGRGPGIWDDLDFVRAERKANRLPDWPAWCWLPSSAALAFTERDDWARVVTAVGAWRQGRSIYRVDAETAAALADTDLPDEIPAHALLELPEWGLYLTGMDTDPPLNGAFVHLDWSFTRRRPELWMVADFGGELDLVVALPMYLDQQSLTASLEQAIKTTGPGEPQSDDMIDLEASNFLPNAEDHRSLLGIVRPIVATLLYICSAEPDIVDPDRPNARPRRAAQPAASPQVWEVGYRIGTALRKARIEHDAHGGHHNSPVAHVRRAHWHTYWLGPKSEPERRRTELRWISPVLVGSDQPMTTVRDLG
jgi:hypothetical protein